MSSTGDSSEDNDLTEAVVLPMTHKEKLENLGIQPPKGTPMYQETCVAVTYTKQKNLIMIGSKPYKETHFTRTYIADQLRKNLAKVKFNWESFTSIYKVIPPRAIITTTTTEKVVSQKYATTKYYTQGLLRVPPLQKYTLKTDKLLNVFLVSDYTRALNSLPESNIDHLITMENTSLTFDPNWLFYFYAPTYCFFELQIEEYVPPIPVPSPPQLLSPEQVPKFSEKTLFSGPEPITPKEILFNEHTEKEPLKRRIEELEKENEELKFKLLKVKEEAGIILNSLNDW